MGKRGRGDKKLKVEKEKERDKKDKKRKAGYSPRKGRKDGKRRSSALPLIKNHTKQIVGLVFVEFYEHDEFY